MLTKNNKLLKIIGQFKGKKILIVGDVMLDSAVWGKVERISPEAPVPVVHVQRETYTAGGAANVANNITALGGQAVLIGLIGADRNGEIFRKVLKDKSIKPDYLLADHQRPTIRKNRIMAIPQHQLLRIDEEDVKPLGQALEKKILEQIRSVLPKSEVVVISDYAKGVISLPIAQQLIAWARQKKIPVIIDPKPFHKDYYRGATVIKPNKKEALEMSGTDKTMEAGRQLQQELGSSIVLTQGEDGVAIFEPGQKPVSIKTKAREIFDVSGAGDTVVATLSLALSGNARLREAAEIANYAAGVVVGKVGTATLDTTELKQAIKHDGQ